MTPRSHLEVESLLIASANITASTQARRIPDAAYVIFAVILTVSWIVGSSFNFVCIFVFLTNHNLRSSANIFIMALNVCDFLMCSIDCPICALSAWYKAWLWGPSFCVAEGFLYYFLIVTSVYIITSISFHRYVIVCRPTWVPACFGKRDYTVCGVCFVIGCMWASLPVFGWSHYQLAVGGVTCGPAWNATNQEAMVYMYGVIAFGLVFPFGVLAFSYVSIIIKIIEISRLQKKWENDSVISRSTISVEKNIMLTCFLIILSFLSCWTPAFVVFILHGMFNGTMMSQAVLAMPPVIGRMQGVLDPIVYVSTNKQMRTATYKWCKDCRHVFTGDS